MITSRWADVNGSGTLDPPPPTPPGGDHQWRFDLEPNGSLRYEHEAVFMPINMPAPIEPGADFRMTVTNAGGEMGMGVDDAHFLEVRVIRYVGDNPVATEGLARVVISEASFEVVIPGVIRPVEEYRVDYYVDNDRNRRKSIMEHSWRQDRVVSGTTSLTLEASLGTDAQFEIGVADPPARCMSGDL